MGKKRIAWIDIYKAIGIFLVVVGHTTVAFNRYIYQFHMPAFFFISGYITNLDKDSVGHYIYKKIYSLFIPLLTMTALGSIAMWILKTTSIYSWLYGESYPYKSIAETISYFFETGTNYVWWLGAAWFIVVLFMVEIIHKILYTFCNKKGRLLYGVASISLYILGYYCVRREIFAHKMFDLAFIGQIFFWSGYMVRKAGLFDKISKKWYGSAVCVIVSLAYLYLAKEHFLATVNYPARTFNNPVVNYCSGIAGSVLLWACSFYLDRIIKGRCKEFIEVIGRNTFGVIVFHFLVYKLIFLAMIGMNMLSVEYLQQLTPGSDLRKYWLVISVLAVLISVVLWKGLKKIAILKTLLGESVFWEKIWNRFIGCIEGREGHIINLMEKCGRYLKYAVVILCLVIWGVLADGYMALFYPLEITFPYDGSVLVSFDDGWLPGSDEEWRWICDEGTVTVLKGRWDSMYVSGYVPEYFDMVTQVKVFINGDEVYKTSVNEVGGWEFATDQLKEYVTGNEIKLKIAFDGVYVPPEESADTRELSGLINTIKFW